MIAELKTAAAFLTYQIRRNLKRKRAMTEKGITEDQLVSFRKALFRVMLFTYYYVWDVDNPTKDQDLRAIRLHGRNGNKSQNECITVALYESGLTDIQVRLRDLNLVLFINPGLVCVEGESTTVYYRSPTQLKEAEEAVLQEDIICILEAKEDGSKSCAEPCQNFLMDICSCWSIERPREL